AIGPGTADALRGHHLVADLVPERFVAEALLEAFPPPHGAGRVLLARAEVARDVLPDGLRAGGWEVGVVDVYRTVPAPADRAARPARAWVAAADIVTSRPSSTVARFLEAVGPDVVPSVVACIGPVTAETARARGLTVDLVADEHTIPGLVAALVAHAGKG